MKKRGKKVESKRGVNMSFSELVQRIVQRDDAGEGGAPPRGHYSNGKVTVSSLILDEYQEEEHLNRARKAKA